jgi:hypothetical protein
MSDHHIPHIPIYEGSKDPNFHWLICETIWDVSNVAYEGKKIAQFFIAPRKKVLT